MKLATERLHVFYGTQHALKGVTLSMPDRAVIALIGPSGCGKSTFLRALNRMHDLTPGVKVRGRILLDGLDSRRLPPEQLRCRIGMLFQRPNPFPQSIRANVGFGPLLCGVRGDELEGVVEHSLRRAALWKEVRGRLDADARTLSGGQQQRLCIARALALEPEVLLMDEPCSALDPAASQSVEALITELAAQITVVLVTHSMGQARRVADQIAFFQDGNLIETGPAMQMLTNPTCPETARFLAG